MMEEIVWRQATISDNWAMVGCSQLAQLFKFD